MDRFDWIELDGGFDDAHDKAVPVRKRPHDGPTYYRAARQMRKAGHFKAAAGLYRKSVGFDEHNYQAWIELTDTLVRANQHEAAETTSEGALDSYRQVRTLYASRALVLASQKNFADAYHNSDISLEGDERSWYARCVRAELLLRQKAVPRDEVFAFLEEAIDLAESPWEAHFLGGWMLLDASLPALAAGYFAEAVRCNPRTPITWLCMGDCFRELRFYDQALFYYQRVVELEPTHELALQRQKMCAPKLYGLMRIFGKENLRKRWKKEYEELLDRWEPDPDDF